MLFCVERKAVDQEVRLVEMEALVRNLRQFEKLVRQGSPTGPGVQRIKKGIIRDCSVM